MAVGLIVLCICCNNKTNRFIEISGKIHDSIRLQNGKYVYLFDAAEKGVIKDSVQIKNNEFVFTLKENTNETLIPFKAKICYWDSTRNKQLLKYSNQDSILRFLRPIGFTNPYKENYIESYFYVNHGINKIVPHQQKETHLLPIHSIEPIGQNEPFFKHHSFDIPNDSNHIDPRSLTKNRTLIKSYPNSYYLLHMLMKVKDAFKKDDLKILIASFNKQLNADAYFREYIERIPIDKNDTSVLANLVLENNNGLREKIITSNQKYTLLVFWASWCAPCRAEIPILKDLFKKQLPLQIISISIDDNISNWKEAMAKENMPWPQYIVKKEDKATIDVLFKIHAIPYTCLVDKNKRIVLSMTGFSDTVLNNIISKIK